MAKKAYKDLGISREANIAHYKTVLLKGEVMENPANTDQFLVVPPSNPYNGKKEPVKKAIVLDKARFTESYEFMDKDGEPSYIVDLGMTGKNSKGIFAPNVVDVLDDKGEPTGEKRPYNDIEIGTNDNGWQTAFIESYPIPETKANAQPAERLAALAEAIKAGEVKPTKRFADRGNANVRDQMLNGVGTVGRRYDRQLAASGRLDFAGPKWLSAKSASGRSLADTTILVPADDMLVVNADDGAHRFVRINDDLCVDVDPSNKATKAHAHPGRGANLEPAEGIESIHYQDEKGKWQEQQGPFYLLGLPKGDEPSLKSYHTTTVDGKFMPILDSPNTPINASNIDYQLNHGRAADNPFKASNAYAKAGRASVKHEPGMIQGTEKAIFRDKFVETFLKPDKENPGNYIGRNQKIRDAHGEAWSAAKGKVSEMVKDLSDAERADLNSKVEEQIAQYTDAAKGKPEFATKQTKAPEAKATVTVDEPEVEADTEPSTSWELS